MSRAAASTLAMLLACLIAACGGGDDSSEEVQREVQSSRQTVADALDDLTLTSRSALARGLISAATTLDEEADDLAAAEAPERLDTARDDLVTSLRALAREGRAAAQSVREGASLVEVARDVQLSPALEGVNRALDALRAEGIDVEPLGFQ